MKKKVSDEVLLNSYKRIGNVWKVGQEVGLCGQSVYDRLVKLHAIKRKNKWLPSDDEVLISKYKMYKKDFKLDELACLYLHAKTVVLDSLARLQAVKHYFQRIIQVGLVGMEEHVYVQFKEVRYILVTERTLFKKLRLVLFQRIGL